MKNTATINERSSRHAEWIKVFGTDVVPIVNILVPSTVNVLGEAREVYMLDLAKLSPEQMQRMKEHLSSKFNVPMDEVERDLPKYGVPILAEDVIITTDQMAFL